VVLGSTDSVAQSVTGTTSLITIPTGEMPDDGTLSFGGGFVNKKYSDYLDGRVHFTPYFIAVSYLPFLEVSFRFSRPWRLDDRERLGDRMVSARLQLLRENKKRPALVFGVHDFLSGVGASHNLYFNALYLVASKHIQLAPFAAGFHLGYGTDWMKARHHQFVGPFGGVSVSPFRFLDVMLEYDGETVNVGQRVTLFKSLEVLVALENLDTFTGGATFRIKLRSVPVVADVPRNIVEEHLPPPMPLAEVSPDSSAQAADSLQNRASAGDKLPVETDPQEPPVVEQPPPVQVAPPDSVGIAPEIEAPAPPEQIVRPPVRFDREKVSWMVVVASLTERASAETVALRHREQLRHTGRLVEVIEGARNGVPYYRVAVGQFGTVAVARTVLEELAQNVLEEKPLAAEDSTAPEIEAPAPPEQAAPEPARFDRKKVSWTVVVASRTQRAPAETIALRYREQLRRTGHLVDVIEGARNGVTYYRVAVGQFETVAAARTVREELAVEIPEDAWLLRLQAGQ